MLRSLCGATSTNAAQPHFSASIGARRQLDGNHAVNGLFLVHTYTRRAFYHQKELLYSARTGQQEHRRDPDRGNDRTTPRHTALSAVDAPAGARSRPDGTAVSLRLSVPECAPASESALVSARQPTRRSVRGRNCQLARRRPPLAWKRARGAKQRARPAPASTRRP
jgi:hypothetical protein